MKKVIFLAVLLSSAMGHAMDFRCSYEINSGNPIGTFYSEKDQTLTVQSVRGDQTIQGVRLEKYTDEIFSLVSSQGRELQSMTFSAKKMGSDGGDTKYQYIAIGTFSGQEVMGGCFSSDKHEGDSL